MKFLGLVGVVVVLVFACMIEAAKRDCSGHGAGTSECTECCSYAERLPVKFGPLARQGKKCRCAHLVSPEHITRDLKFHANTARKLGRLIFKPLSVSYT